MSFHPYFVDQRAPLPTRHIGYDRHDLSHSQLLLRCFWFSFFLLLKRIFWVKKLLFKIILKQIFVFVLRGLILRIKISICVNFFRLSWFIRIFWKKLKFILSLVSFHCKRDSGFFNLILIRFFGNLEIFLEC